MKRKFYALSMCRLVIAMMLLCGTHSANAQQTDTNEAIITFKTNIYDTYGSENQFSLVLGSITEGNYQIDCGFGKEDLTISPAVYNDEDGSISGTFVSCTVSADGIVKIYGDAANIDYLNASGCYIESIQFPEVVNLDVLELSHNELKSLDLSTQTKLRALYLSDNTFSAESPLVVGYKPELSILEVSIIEYMDESFSLSDYPALVSFDGYHNAGLKQIDPTGCPDLARLTLDVTDVESVDVSKNPNLMILNVSETKVTSLDLSNNPLLHELYCSHRGSYNNQYKLTSLDISNNPNIVYLFCSGNKFTEIDLTNNTNLVVLDISDNYLTSIDLSKNTNLYQVYLNLNCMDFATLPENPGTWNTYYYNQRNMNVDKSYPVGEELDFSSRVLRDGTNTVVNMYAISESNPSEPILLDESYYTYNSGKITLNKEYSDSVYFAFSNTLFNENDMVTRKFKIKSQADYGTPTRILYFSSNVSSGADISFGIGAQGASPENPVEFFVNLGDGDLKTFTATSVLLPNEHNVIGKKAGYGPIEVYAPEGATLSALEIKGISISSIDLSMLASLQQLRLSETDLYRIDLSWNRCLELLDLSYNNLSMLTLEGNNAGYGKNMLSDINLSHNQLTDVTLNDLTVVRNLNLSYNKLEETPDFDSGDYILNIDFSHNLLAEADFAYCRALTDLDVSHNQLSSIILPEESVLQHFVCNNNNFTIATLPLLGNLAEDNYIYAPQSDLLIATKGPGADLSEQIYSANGQETSFVWKKESGEIIIEGTDYEVIDGITSFLNIEMGKVFCEMTNPAFPAFTGENVYKTTLIEAAGMPTNMIASFTTTKNNEQVELSLAAAKAGTALYIDWKGNNTVSQYLLGSTYKLFTAKTKADTEVRVYTYEPEEAITVFSMSGATLSSFDGSKLTDAINISVSGAGLTDISLPEGSTVLSEMTLENNNFRRFDLSKYPALRTVALSGNNLTSIDLSANANLELFSAANNRLSDITLNNNKLWALYLDHNNLSDIDLSGAPNISQLSLSNNDLTQIDIEPLDKLIMLVINNNYFTFKTLPLKKDKYVVYYYYNQYPIDITAIDRVVDLSEQKEVNATPTLYRWFSGMPTVNEEGELEGTELIADTDYTIVNGITTFLADFENVVCIMTNEQLPDVYIYTYLINVTAGMEYTPVDSPTITVNGRDIIISNCQNGKTLSLYTLDGTLRYNTQSQGETAIIHDIDPGIYIVRIDSYSVKIIVR